MGIKSEKIPNALSGSSSPYLLQHAYNPVYWYPWGEEALQKARDENKLLIISIGYSSCHWCHVMEHESFEDVEVAELMNRYFISIKVDREERPDIDHIYMDAVQLMTQHGGWPLNCIALPDQRPLYGGTYFPKQQWISILKQLADLYNNDPQKCHSYASELTTAINKIGILPDINNNSTDISTDEIESIFTKWLNSSDDEEGGPQRVPKFPMPDNYRTLLQYHFYTGNQKSANHIQLTLKKMAYGGINDQVGGGFARYSTDRLWKVPHFEKMLYDNAQLITLYSEAYRAFRNPLYLDVVIGTMEFIIHEMTASSGAFYSALDADSEGVEGLFYTWTKDELENLIGEIDFPVFSDYYNINDKGYWEEGRYILLRDEETDTIAKVNGLTVAQLRDMVNRWKLTLMNARKLRVRPGLDDKILCGWNGLMITACTDAYLATGRKDYLEMGEKCAVFILEHLSGNGNILYRFCNDNGYKSYLQPAFLEDYSLMIESFIRLYETTFDDRYLLQAQNWADYVIRNFSAHDSPYFYFTSRTSEELIARKIETQDNVIPSGNSVMADNLFRLSIHFNNPEYKERVLKMMVAIREQVKLYAPWHSRWAQVSFKIHYPQSEVVFSGKNARNLLLEWSRNYYPDILIAGSENASGFPLLDNRFEENETRIYLCRDQTCQSPVTSVDETRSVYLSLRG